MADAALFIGWGQVVRGREERALEVFNESVAYWGGLQSSGKIEDFEVVLLAPHGGELGGFALLRGSADQIASLQFDEEFDRQVKLYVECFGKLPVCANTHCLRASGWADTARFGARRGLLGENSLIHHRVPPMNPTNLFGAPFGTMYPFFVYDDAAHGNERLVFVSVPIGFYEPGGAAGEESHPLFGKETFREDEYRRVTELACRYGWTLNLFIHPMSFLSKQYRTRETLQCMRDRVNELGARAVWHGTDAVTLWWHARAGTRLECRPGKREFTAAVAHAGGVLVRFLDTGLPAGAFFTLDGRPLAAQRRSRLGRDWLYVLVPQGEHTLKVSGKGGPCSA